MIGRRRESILEPDAENEGNEGSRRHAAVLEVIVMSASHDDIGDDGLTA